MKPTPGKLYQVNQPIVIVRKTGEEPVLFCRNTEVLMLVDWIETRSVLGLIQYKVKFLCGQEIIEPFKTFDDETFFLTFKEAE